MDDLKYTVVPTKQHDGGDDRPNQPRRVEGETTARQEPDAFSRYSSNLLRMKALLLCSEEDDRGDDLEAVGKINEIFRSAGMSDLLDINHPDSADDTSSKRRRGNNTLRPIQHGYSRKTRLSFEVHPCLLLHDIFGQLDLAETESAQAISDDEAEPEDKKQSN